MARNARSSAPATPAVVARPAATAQRCPTTSAPPVYPVAESAPTCPSLSLASLSRITPLTSPRAPAPPSEKLPSPEGHPKRESCSTSPFRPPARPGSHTVFCQIYHRLGRQDRENGDPPQARESLSPSSLPLLFLAGPCGNHSPASASLNSYNTGYQARQGTVLNLSLSVPRIHAPTRPMCSLCPHPEN